ncbi:MAG TPA: hypothetical protein PLZ84_03680, partial [Clostridia bacterium]|nr:hypothetical protein [Clostridia bacterium]
PIKVDIGMTKPGAKGVQGEQGPPGKSAYEVWLDAGNTGTETDFFNSLLADMASYTDVTAVDNVFALDVGNKVVKSFRIETEDNNAKEIAFSNVPTEAEIVIELNYTNAAAITYPAGITWLNGIPVLSAGKRYRLLLMTSNGGTTYDAVCVGGW